MEVLDAQVHLNQIVPNWRTADLESILQASVAAMDAVGIDTVLIAETWGFDAQMRRALRSAPGGGPPGETPFSELAVARYPNRFGYLTRVEPFAPDVAVRVAEVRSRPGALCLRIVPIPETGEVDDFAQGRFEPLFAAAEEAQVPIFVWLPSRAHLLVPYLRKFPRLPIILDHCGVGLALPLVGTIAPTRAGSATPLLADRLAQLDQVIAMAEYPNLALKWAHAVAFLSAEPYPHRDVVRHLRRVLDAFGPERVLWASDYTQNRSLTGQSWTATVQYLRDTEALSETEKEWLLGRAARRVLRWAYNPPGMGDHG
jgi:predicted TIM-barrel fold metal-dependent hydrolase